MTMPTLLVDIGFSVGASTGAFLHLDDTARGRLDTGTLAPDLVWTDVSAFTRSVFIHRGSARVDSPIVRYEAGTCTIVLDNTDRRFDPTNLAGPYVSGGVTQVTPMRAVRVRAVWDGVTYDLWRGFADAWQISYTGPNYSEVAVTATDAFKVLAAYDRMPVDPPVGVGETTGARVHRILDSAGWRATDRIVAAGDTTVQATTLEGAALNELFLVADTEIGELYVDAAGRLVFRNRLALLKEPRSTTPQAVFGDTGGELPYASVLVAYDDTTLANLVRVARVDGEPQTAQDQPSQDDYLVHTFDRSDLLMETDQAAADYARWILHIAKDPELRFDELAVNPQRDPTALYPQVLAREIGDRVTVNRRPPGGGTITRDVVIRGVTHDITPSDWQTTWVLQNASRFSAFLVLDHATLGQLDANALAF